MGTRARSIRLDEDVWAEIAKLRAVYGTDNAAMRAVFNLAGVARVKRVERVDGQVPTVVVEKMPADMSVSSVVTKIDGGRMEYTRPSWERKPLLKPSEKGKR